MVVLAEAVVVVLAEAWVSPVPEPLVWSPLPEPLVSEITGFSTVHGLASEHKFCVLSEVTNPFEMKSVTPEERSEALPANTTVI